MDWAKKTPRRNEKHLGFGIWWVMSLEVCHWSHAGSNEAVHDFKNISLWKQHSITFYSYFIIIGLISILCNASVIIHSRSYHMSTVQSLVQYVTMNPIFTTKLGTYMYLNIQCIPFLQCLWIILKATKKSCIVRLEVLTFVLMYRTPQPWNVDYNWLNKHYRYF